MLCKIIENKNLGMDHYRLIFNSPEISKKAFPGQFVMIRTGKGTYPLLRRPFCVYKTINNSVSILYKVKGAGTEKISCMKKGNFVDVIGPFGKGFLLPDKKFKALLVGGGYGIAPLVGLAYKLKKTNSCFGIKVFIGAKKKSLVFCASDFKKLGIHAEICTEDGSVGKKALVSGLLERHLKKENQNSVIFSCGPNPMLKEIAKLADKYNVLCQVSVEQVMGCGMGICLSCACKSRNEKGYKLVCSDGPVFNSSEIKL